MFQKLKNLTRAPEEMDADAAHQSSRFGVNVTLAVALLMLIVAMVLAFTWAEPTSKLYPVIVKLRVSLTGLYTGALAYLFAAIASFCAFQVVENSHMGQRITRGLPGGKATIYLALVIGACIIFSGK